MARENKTQYAVLGCLLIKPMTAYEIGNFMQQYTAHFWAEREGQLYPTFKALLQKGFVKCKEIPAQKTGVKKLYSITPQGKKIFNQWFQSETEKTTERNPMLLKLFFGRSQPVEKVKQVLEEGFQEKKQTFEILSNVEKIIQGKKLKGIDTRFYQMTLAYGIELTKAELNWFKKTIEQLNKNSKP